MGHHHGSQWLDSWCGQAGWVIEEPVWLFGTAPYHLLGMCSLIPHILLGPGNYNSEENYKGL